ncbi:MAG: arsenate reductase ArsC [Defluviicoccus sp.]|nr:arsenate reductase ArsC [Defluviicoccus sp.]
MTDDKIFNVLFLCTGNSARSILAEAILAREGMSRFKAFSAGSKPAGQVNPNALALLGKLNHDVSGFRSKDWNEFVGDDAPRMDFVFTVCDDAANEVCPVWPGQPMSAHWGIPDPAAATGTQSEIAAAFVDTYRMLTNRISIFVNLPIASLDRLALQERLDDIGRTGRPRRNAR